MATIGTERNGHRRILFVADDASRKTIRLGKCTAKQAEAVKVKIEALIAASITGQQDDEVSRWIATLSDQLHARIANAGLLVPRAKTAVITIRQFAEAYLSQRADMKQRTATNLRQTIRWLDGYFKERDVRSIAEAEARGFQAHMITSGLAQATYRRHIGRSRQLWRAAIRQEAHDGPNPFEGIPCTVRADKSRQAFITRESIASLLEACPNAQWRLMILLSRYGGLRCPSEVLALTWQDIHWDKDRIRVPSPKTEHIPGKEFRIIPLFPELRGTLLENFEQARPGESRVITIYPASTANLRTQFTRIIERAGLTPWPKPWHNLRASRETELADHFPQHVVCAWIGNSKAVAQEHYLQLTDDHFRRAVAGGNPALPNPAQNPARQPAKAMCTAMQTGTDTTQKSLNLQAVADTCPNCIPAALPQPGWNNR